MQLVLLAAGRGLRLKDKTTHLPKTLLKLGSKPILHHILASLKILNGDELIVVGGFEYGQIARAMKAYAHPYRMALNKDYVKGNLLSIMAARDFISDAFIVMNADHIYSHRILAAIADQIRLKPGSLMIACDDDRPLGPDDMKVKLKDGRFEVMSKSLKAWSAGYVGLSCIPHALLSAYWQTADEVLAQHGDGAHGEMVINAMASGGHPVGIIDVSGSHWIEVDTEEDLALASRKIVSVTHRE